MFYIGFLFKKWVIHSFPHFWWAMWANRSGRYPKMSHVSESLRLLTKNEWPWVICSDRSPKMSDHERIAQAAHQKWANEWIARFWSELLIRSENLWAYSQPYLYAHAHAWKNIYLRTLISSVGKNINFEKSSVLLLQFYWIGRFCCKVLVHFISD